MRRVMILGGPGSGKSTLARRLGARLGVPAIHLDQLYHQPGWADPPPEAFEAVMATAVALPDWVIDGNYLANAAARLDRADTLIALVIPRHRRMTRLIRRVIRHYGRQRPDSAEGCLERFDPVFFAFAWRWDRDNAPAMFATLAAFPGRRIMLRSTAEVEGFLSNL